jgi:hypothetical protein
MVPKKWNKSLMNQKPGAGFRIDWDHPLATGLVGWWLLNEGIGITAFDSSQQGNHATLAGTTPTRWSGGPSGPLLWMTGTHYVDTNVERVGSTGLFASSTERFSVSAWFSTSVNSTIVARASGTGANRTFQLFTSAGALLVYVRGSSAFITTAYTLGAWYHTCVTWDGSLARLYVDGVFKGSTAAGTAAEETGQRIIIGARTNGTAALLNGLIDDIRIYDRALSSDEIGMLYSDPYSACRSDAYVYSTSPPATISPGYIYYYRA